MALWQYRLTAVPAAGVLSKYGYIPDRLFIDEEGWKQYWSHQVPSDSFPKPVFEDAYTTKWWAGLQIAAAPLAAQIDLLLPRATWFKPDPAFISWKSNDSDIADNDCSISVAVAVDALEDFEFRTDFRTLEKAFPFLKAMLALCAERDLLVLDGQGNLMPPDLTAVFPSVENSPAVRFLLNPQDFLEKALREQKGL